MLQVRTKFVGGLSFVCVAALAGSAAASDVDLIAYYDFEDANALGTDASGNGHHLEVHGSPESISGQVGDAVAFDGAEDLLTYEDIEELYSGSSLSVTFWVQTHSEDGQTISRPASTAGGLTFYTLDQQDDYRVVSNNSQNFNSIRSFEPAVDDQWTHIGYTYDIHSGPDANGDYTGTARMYIDGELMNTEEDLMYASGGFRFGLGGRGNFNEYFEGAIDEFAIYGTVLGDSAIEGLYDGTYTPLTVPEPGTLGLVGTGLFLLGRRRHRA